MTYAHLTETLTELAARGVTVGPRENYYEGEHTSSFDSTAWDKSFGRLLRGVRDNQCALVCDTRADALRPTNYTTVDSSPLAESEAQWASDLLDSQGETVDRLLRTAMWSATQTAVIVTESEGQVAWVTPDPRNLYVKKDQAGTYLFAGHLWKDGRDTNVTVYSTETVQVWTSQTDKPIPTARDFVLASEEPNTLGEIPVAVVERSQSIIDRVRPQNDLLNKSLQTQAVAGEAYVMPLRVWIGVQVINPHTGEVTGPNPSVNPATGSKDVSLPTATDEEGGQRSVTQLTPPSPSAFLAEQDSLRASIARLAQVPAFMLQVGGNAPSGDALEQAYLPFLSAKVSDERVFRPFFDRLAMLSVLRRRGAAGSLLKVPPMRTMFSSIATSTLTARVAHMVAAVEAGMTLGDALVEFLGWSVDAAADAELAAADRDAEAQVTAARAFDSGTITAL
jgi:hypothetical protein